MCNNLKKLCEEFNLDEADSIDYYLKELDLYSKEITRVKKNNISRMMILIENILKYIKSNVNIDLVLDKFVIEMRNYYE